MSQIYFWTITVFFFPTLSTWGLLSDFKICGDSECESLLSRVRATRHHMGKDCWFLNFKKGDVIFVYYKLSGKRDDLWAGTIDRRFGYFPKDAVEVEELYANTEKVVATKKDDFFCIDEYGAIIDNDSSEFLNEDLDSEFQETLTNDAQDSKTSKDFSKEKYPSVAGTKDISDDIKPPDPPSEQGGSEWIGSTVTGWLGLGGEISDDNSKEDDPEQEAFRSRKLSLNIDENQLKGETEKSGWFEDGLTSAFGFGQKAPKEEIEKELEKQPPPSNSWLNIGIKDVLHFGHSNQDEVGQGVQAAGREKDADPDEMRVTTNPQDLDSGQSRHDATVEQIGKTEHHRDDSSTSKEISGIDTFPLKAVEDYKHGQEDHQEEIDKDVEFNNEDDTGWYGSFYNNIAGIYGEDADEKEKRNTGLDKNKDVSIQSETESVFFSSIFGNLPSPFQGNTPNNDENSQSDTVEDIKEADAETEIYTAQNSSMYDSTEVPGMKDDNVINKAPRPVESDQCVNTMHDAFRQLLQTCNNLSSSPEPQLQEKTQILNVEVDPENAIAEFSENVGQNCEGILELDVTTNAPVSSRGAVELNQLISDLKPDDEGQQISTTFHNGLLHFSGEDVSNHHQESSAADLAEDSLGDIDADQSVGQDNLKSDCKDILNLSDSSPVQTQETMTQDRVPSQDTALVHAEVEDIGTTGAVVSSDQTVIEDNILVSQILAEEESDNHINTPDTDAPSLLEDIKQTLDLSLHESQEAYITEPSHNISQTEPVTEDFSGEEGHGLITANEDGESTNKIGNRLEAEDTKNAVLMPALLINNEGSKSNVMEVVDQKECLSSDHSQECHVESNPKDNIGLIKMTNDPGLDLTIGNAAMTTYKLSTDEDNNVGEGVRDGIASKIEKAGSSIGVTETDEVEPGNIFEVDSDHKAQGSERHPDSSEVFSIETISGRIQRQTEILEETDTERFSKEDFIYKHSQSHKSQKDNDKENVLKDRSSMMHDQMKAIEHNNPNLEKWNQMNGSNQIFPVHSQEILPKRTEGFYNEIISEKKGAKEICLDNSETSNRPNNVDQIHDVSQVSATGGTKDVISQSDRTVDHDPLNSSEDFLSHSQLNSQEAIDSKSTISDKDKQQNLESIDMVEIKEEAFEKNNALPNELIDNVVRESATTASPSETFGNQDLTSRQIGGPDNPQNDNIDKSVNKDRSFFENALTFFIPSMATKDSEAKGQENETQEPSPYISELDLDELELEAQSTSVEDSDEATFLTYYKNILKHLSEEDTTTLLDLFGKNKLLWLEYIQRSSECFKQNQDVDNGSAIISDFERFLQYHMDDTKTTSDGLMEDDYKSRKPVSLQNLEILLSDIKKRLPSMKATVSMKDNQDRDKTNCNNEDCFTSKENKELTSLKGEHISTEGDQSNSQMNGLTRVGDKPSVVEHLLASARQVTGSTTANLLTVKALLKLLTSKVTLSLPDDIRPGPDLYGLPWEAVIVTALLGLGTFLLFSCRFYQCIKSRMYSGKERQMGQKVAELLDEKCKVLETLSEAQQMYDKLESTLRNSGVFAYTAQQENLEVMSEKLKKSNSLLEKELEALKEDLNFQRLRRLQQEKTIADMQETLKTLEEETVDLKSHTEQAQTTLKIYDMNSERNQNNLEAAKEEKALLQEKNAQLVQEAEGWRERMSELEEEMRMCENSYTGMLQDASNKDERIKSLTDCLLKMKEWDFVLEGGANGEEINGTRGVDNGEGPDNYQRQRIQKLIDAAKINADFKSVDEDKDRVFAKLTDEIKAKEDLQEGIKKLENEKDSLRAESEQYTAQVQKLQQKLQIMTEMYQENELKLHRMLTVEERERLQKEEKLTKADRSITLAVEELGTYRKRTQDLEDELEKTNQAYKIQITSQEKKAHNNWLAARAADRDLAEVKRENAHLRQKLTDTQFKMDVVEKDPYALENMGIPFRGERSPYGPSPLGRPTSETRAFLSPPTLMDGPPRLSPNFPLMGPGGRVSRGLLDPPCGVDSDRSGGPHSDSGSLSPTWERDRRGPPLPPPGYKYPEPGLPYRRPPPGAFPFRPMGPMGPLPPRGPGPTENHSFGPHTGDQPDVQPFMGNNMGPGEIERDSNLSTAADLRDMRMPPDADFRMGPPPFPPMDPYMARRGPPGPYGPPDFFPLRGPVGHPMGMRGPPPPGMFGRFPPPQHMGYAPLRPHLDSFPPGPPPRPSPPGSEQSPDQSPSPHDVI
ncbi:hypothetical protein UPYG_G00231200 [Umbra pygmaea]|uniref:SH3 domain-containing protein n=1 Tax=Umbra pygmaea TaxID=75934 RepID=A0ABD0WIR5_UMBPY